MESLPFFVLEALHFDSTEVQFPVFLQRMEVALVERKADGRWRWMDGLIESVSFHHHFVPMSSRIVVG